MSIKTFKENAFTVFQMAIITGVSSIGITSALENIDSLGYKHLKNMYNEQKTETQVKKDPSDTLAARPEIFTLK